MKLVGKGNAGPPTLAAAVESGVGEFRVVAQNHEVHRSDGQQRIRTTVGSSELDFEGRTVIGHDNGAYLTATQQDVLAAFEVLRGGIFQKRDNVMHLDLAVHPLQYGQLHHDYSTPRKGKDARL